MSILRKPYEISVWDDVWSTADSKFIEQRLGIIGSSEMESQSRVIEPELTRNVNGTKKFSFKLYKRYRDNITGETVENPFYNWLTNERKVKLKYDGEWYDFVVKNISEPSSNYLYTYQLEDANVQELSKNGFNFIFDPELQNNLGTSQELATALLAETDWTVGECDVPVQTIDEALVYLKTLVDIVAYQIQDPDESGITQVVSTTIPSDTVVLAAYSSCTGRPHRFQFFWVKGMVDEDGNLTDVLTKDDNRFINNENCQYYIDFDYPSDNYREYGNYIIPGWFETATVAEYPGESGVTLSSEFRGKRYGFTQQTEYIPGLERYVNLYKNNAGKTYYGYENTEYHSPILVQNLISGSQLKSTSGWVGTTTASNNQKATVEAVYGTNPGSNFKSSLEDLASGDYSSEKEYKPYIKITFPDDGGGLVVNSGPHDNRRLIGNMEVGDQYKIDCSYVSTDSNAPLRFALCECIYSPDGKYNYVTDKISFSELDENGIITVSSSNYSKEDFIKNSEVRLCIYGSSGVIYYIEKISLYKVAYYKDSQGNSQIITPDLEISTDVNNNTIDTTYYYIDASTTPTSPDSVIPTTITKTLTYETYEPVYNEGGCKVRTVTAKESNYFNILQSIAETFGQWLEINVVHDDDGTRLSKSVAFRNYVGHNNYVGFKYGVNLKDIKRTYESKKLVTKLIVKQNSNEFAPNGFCTIARADANPTGENTIYDFQYFFNTGMMSARDYLEATYVKKSDAPEDSVQGYFPRIRDYNIQIQKDNDTLLNLSKDLVQINAELEVATVGYQAALDGIEETDEQIRFLTGYNISELNRYLSGLSDDKKEQESQILERSDVKKAIQEYSVYQSESKKYRADKTRLTASKTAIETKYNAVVTNINTTTKSKENLHKQFFATYNRFIQEGTWISEDYVDDEKYYADALSVLFNSCYPKVAYDVNVIEISKLPGYEGYAYDLGDITFVEDKEFFGDDFRVEVSVTETTDNLDDPSKNKIKIQNFKDQFQDLFQKITATVQQAQYSTGSYEKAVALAEAGQERKQQFLTDALDGMSSRLAVAGQQTVVIDSSGITVTDEDAPSESIRMVGGAIMLSKQDANGEQKWTTGLTSDGVSANLITAGVINAGQIAIMNSDQPAFRWDTYGISAFETTWYEGVVSGFDNSKFVRFDKNGIYGIDGTVNGLNWHPQDGRELDDINSKATFALTWDGLKVTGNNNAVAHIGKVDGNIINITQGTGKNKKSTFRVSNTGDVYLSGNFTIGGIDSSSGSSEETTFIDYVKEQVDKKASLYYLNKDPALYEDNNKTGEKTWGADQISSMWRCTAKIQSNKSTKDSTLVTRDANSEWIWQKLSETEYGWHEMEIPDNIFDAYDGKNTIHVTKPSNYKKRDLWIVNETYTSGKKTYTVGTLMVAINDSSGEWSAADWEEKVKYTDDTVANSKMDPTVDTGAYTWSFDIAKGMSMNQGDTNVFKINDKGLYIKGNGEFTGTITANGGEIGGCKITNGKLEVSAANIKDKLTADQIDVSALKVGLITFGNSGEYYINPNGFTDTNYPYIIKLPCFEIKNDYTTGSPYNTICGWTMSDDGMYKAYNDTILIGMNAKKFDRWYDYNYSDYACDSLVYEDQKSSVAFYCGSYNNHTPSECEFKVLQDGSLYASAAEIEGKITATSGEIGGCKITNGVLKISADTNITGTLTATKIAATEGTIGGQEYNWIIGEYGSYGNIYCGQSTMPSTSYGTTTNNVYIGTDGLAYVGSNVTTCLRGGAVWMYSNRYTTSIGYQVTQFLRNGTKVGSITIMSNQDVLSIHGTWKFMNDVQNSGGETQFTSDINLKNSIQDVPENYDIMFNQLQPVIFKYNNGTSGRYHTGFIAQQVDQAIQKAQISREDFSAICIDKNDDNEETWYLRYSNFIPINTWQIQKLKARVTELENKLNSLLQGENTNETTNNI